jgi:hypothetical protein
VRSARRQAERVTKAEEAFGELLAMGEVLVREEVLAVEERRR